MSSRVQDELIEALAPLTHGLFAAGARRCRIPTVPGGFAALLAWLIRARSGSTVVWVCDGAATLESRHRDLLTASPSPGTRPTPLLYYPEWEALPEDGRDRDLTITGQRLAALDALQVSDQAPYLIATCVQAVMQRTLSPDHLRKHAWTLALGAGPGFDETVAHLVGSGYSHAVEVQEKGQLSVKGGLLDVWAPSEIWPVRIEFFGDDVISMRYFDPLTQRSRETCDSIQLNPAGELGLPSEAGKQGGESAAGLLDYLPGDAVFVWEDPGSIESHAAVLEEALAEEKVSNLVAPFAAVQERIASLPQSRQVFLGGEDDDALPTLNMDIHALQHVLDLPRDVLHPDLMEGERQRLLDQLLTWETSGWRVTVFFDTEGGRDRFEQRLKTPRRRRTRLNTVVGALSEGFVCEELKLAVVSEADIVGRRKRRASRYDPHRDTPRPTPDMGARVADLSSLEPGDFVVHADHGLGLYRGLSEIVFSGQKQEVLTIEYDGEAKLHVPVTQAHLLSRYVGSTRNSPRLHRLGGKRWTAEKDAAQESIVDLASSLLETQARRNALSGHMFPPDTPWQREFELSFPYQETPDQEKAMQAVKEDLESSRPADRLVCGDAGYGKTEVAMRAAFKAVMSGRQVAVLVPTTILAQQHYETFSERMSAFPVRVEVLSRFRSMGERTKVIEGLIDGTVDIVIGTHALVQPHVKFKQLGLVIIDEEQRFGVKHKEQLKHVRALVDVLTLTATPIPRTLYLSLTGARDMSLIQTPPRERMAIETIATRLSDAVLRRAILRELNREGQVFYLHNRVMTIERVRERLQRVVPEARFAVAHGQMASDELSAVMHAFVRGDFDVLVCTTIIESGVDIPRVNTILIDRADRFGIADLYQLRGRVGRSNHKAYAYLLLPEKGPVDTDARRRINAVKKYSHLGAGFSLALKDLEIRGAGNILGAKQSGHIAAVGFGLYCQLLGRSIARLRGEAVPEIVETEVRLDFLTLAPTGSADSGAASLPYDYIDDEGLRVAVYNRLAQCVKVDDIGAIRAELVDRFGALPPAARRLFRVAELRLIAAGHGLRRVEVVDGKVRLLKGENYLMAGNHFPRLTSRSADDGIEEVIRLVVEADQWVGL